MANRTKNRTHSPGVTRRSFLGKSIAAVSSATILSNTIGSPLGFEAIRGAHAATSPGDAKGLFEIDALRPKSRKKAVVIGAGIAGLSGAYLLKKAGFEVTVLEKEPRLGGRMSTQITQGFLIDRGAHLIPKDAPTMFPLLREVGMLAELRTVTPRGGIFRNGKSHVFNMLKPPTLLASGLLRWNEIPKPRFYLNALQDLAHVWRLPVNDFSRWTRVDTESCARWGNFNVGRWSVEYLMDPILSGVFFQFPEQTSKAFLFWVMSYLLSARKVFTLNNGMEVLPKKLAGIVGDVRLGETVLSVEQVSDQVRVATSNGVIEADWVILAVPAPVAKKILSSPTPREQALLDVEYATTVNITVPTRINWHKYPRLSHLYTTLHPRKERKRISCLTFESSKEGREFGDGEMMQIYLDQKAGKELIQASDAEIWEAIRDEMDGYLPGFSESAIFPEMIRWQNVMPLSPVGRARDVNAYCRGLANERKIVLAGDYTNLPCTDGAAFSGLRAGRAVLEMESVRSDPRANPPRATL